MIELDKLCMHCMGYRNHSSGICPHCGADPAANVNAPNQLECGSILAGAYLVGCVLGQGGFGITYIGLDLNLNQKVAIKEYYPEGFVTREGQARTLVVPLPGERKALFESGKQKFINEAQILAKFSDDPSIVDVRGFFQENGTAYIVMRFVEGVTLKQYVQQHGGKLPAAEVLAMMEPLFATLSKVHAAGLLHRDISPDNIMRKTNGTLVLIDFGAARQMSIDGEHSMTINIKHGYAPEEQYRTHGEQGPWTDVYALCATIYRLTTGVVPQQALERAMSDAPLLPPNILGADFTTAQQQAILHGLAVRADRRTQSIAQLHIELMEDGVPKAPPIHPDRRNDNPRQNPRPKPRRATKSRGVSGTMIALVIASIAVVGIALVILLKPSQPENDAAVVEASQTMYVSPVVQEPSHQPTLAPTATPRIYMPVGSFAEGKLAAGSDYSLVLLDDGTVKCYGGKASGVYDDVQDWKDIVWISGYDNHAVGIRKNGTLATAGTDEDGELDVLDLSNVTQVVTGYRHTVALTADGSVYFRGNPKHDRDNCQQWTHVKKLLGGDDHLAVVFNDGTMAAVGYNGFNECDVDGVNGAIGGAVASGTTYVLNSDHTVTPYGEDWCDEDDVRGWSDIIYVDGGDRHTVGLTSRGTVEATGDNAKNQLDAKYWKDMVAICAGQFHTIGIDTYGIIHIAGLDGADYCAGDGDSIWQ